MDYTGDGQLSRRAFAGAAASFKIVPRHVLGAPFIPPSDRITLASIGLGRQGQAITMELLARSDVQVVAVCDCNRFSKDYAEYGENENLCHVSVPSTARTVSFQYPSHDGPSTLSVPLCLPRRRAISPPSNMDTIPRRAELVKLGHGGELPDLLRKGFSGHTSG